MILKHDWIIALLLALAAGVAHPTAARAQDEDGNEDGTVAPSVGVAQPRPAIEPGAPFADHAILQREMKVPVWGMGADVVRGNVDGHVRSGGVYEEVDAVVDRGKKGRDVVSARESIQIRKRPPGV